MHMPNPKRPIAIEAIGAPRTRPTVFWIATFATTTAIVLLLREVLLPFVAGMALAYLFNPLAIASSAWA